MIFTILIHLAQTQSAPAPQAPGAGLGGFLVPMTLMLVMAYFLLIRPQKKRQVEQQRLLSALKTGDRVVTNAGIHGLISNVKETTVIVKVADNVKIEMEKTAIANVVSS